MSKASTPEKTASAPKKSPAAKTSPKAKKPAVTDPEKSPLIGENTSFKVTLSWKEVEKAQESVLARQQSGAKLEGFRKGKAPIALIAQNLGEKGLRDLTLEAVLPDMYRTGLQENKFLPLTDPEVRLESIEPNADWTVTFIIATPSEVKLDGYEKIVTELKKKHEAWKDKKSDKTEKSEEKADATAEAVAEAKRGEQINAVIEALLEKIEVVIPELLVRTETERRLRDLGKQLEQLNMSVDDYLARTQRTLEQIQQEIAAQSLLALQVEMLLGAIIRHSKITVDHDLVHKALPTDREASREEHDYVESMLLKQAAVDHLLTL